MSTDPFNRVGVLNNEISQSTYAELIYTKTRVGKAFPPQSATVNNSYRRLAFSKPGPIQNIQPQVLLDFVPVPPRTGVGSGTSGAAPQLVPYNLRATDQTTLRLQRIASDFDKLLRNTIGSIAEAFDVPAIQDVDCLPPDCSILIDPCFNIGINEWNILGFSSDDTSSIQWQSSTKKLRWNVDVRHHISNLNNWLTTKQSFTGLTPGDAFSVQFDYTFVTTENPGFQVTINSSFTIITDSTGNSGTFTKTIIVPLNGIVQFLLIVPDSLKTGTATRESIDIDNVFICTKQCSRGISSISTLIQWGGTPRSPVNVFNIFARITFRDPDTLITSKTDLIPLNDGRLGTVTPTACGTGDTCDFWKQQGDGGIAQTAITNIGINPTITATIVAGQTRDVSNRLNWLWSISSGTPGKLQDALMTLWPDSPARLVQSVEFLVLTHQILNQKPSLCVDLDHDGFMDYPSPPIFPGLTFDGTTYRNTGVFGPVGGVIISAAVLRFLNNPIVDPPYTSISISLSYKAGVPTPSTNTISKVVFIVYFNGIANQNVVAHFDLTPIGDGMSHPFSWSANILVPGPLSADKFTLAIFIHSQFNDNIAAPKFEFSQPIFTVCGADPTISTENDECPEAACDPDPGTSIDLVFRYTNALGQNRQFSHTFSTNALMQTIEPFPSAPNNWDALVSLGNGILPPTARWESALFLLDTIDGSGLDQCSIPLSFSTTGQGVLNFGPFIVTGNGQAVKDCVATIEISEVKTGVSVDEEQSIALPAPSGGTWTLTFNDGTTQASITIAAAVTTDELQAQLEGMPNIGNGNVIVTGTGTIDDPFVVQFVKSLGSRHLKLLVANGTNLIGCSSGLVTKLRTGTTNERQTITKAPNINDSLIIKFNGIQSSPIPFNASLNQMQSFLDGISSIGVGNVTVSGSLTDPNAPYQGPWIVDFVGALAAQNVPKLTPQTAGYSAITNWQGGVGTDEIQQISITANVGTWKLSITKPDNSATVTTAPLSLTISAAELKAAILAAASWLASGDLIIKTVPPTTNSLLHEWTVEFTGTYASTSFPLMAIDTIGLTGCHIIVIETVKGSGAREQQKILVKKAESGTYRLGVTIGNHPITFTTNIPFDATADEVQFELSQTTYLTQDGDVSVKDTTTAGPNVTASFIVSFDRRFGHIPIMTVINNLFCNPLNLPFVPPPPYEYPLPDCGLPQDGCSPALSLCRPGEGGAEIPDELCCEPITIRDSANYYREVVLERELFDPHQVATIRDMASAKGLKLSAYNAYAHDFETGELRPINMTDGVGNQTSTVLIETIVDTAATRTRIGQQLLTRQNILPSRMIW